MKSMHEIKTKGLSMVLSGVWVFMNWWNFAALANVVWLILHIVAYLTAMKTSLHIIPQCHKGVFFRQEPDLFCYLLAQYHL